MRKFNLLAGLKLSKFLISKIRKFKLQGNPFLSRFAGLTEVPWYCSLYAYNRLDLKIIQSIVSKSYIKNNFHLYIVEIFLFFSPVVPLASILFKGSLYHYIHMDYNNIQTSMLVTQIKQLFLLNIHKLTKLINKYLI